MFSNMFVQFVQEFIIPRCLFGCFDDDDYNVDGDFCVCVFVSVFYLYRTLHLCINC